MPMKKILVPTDFSPSAYNAFAYALSFAEEVKASISLLHVIQIDMGIVDLPIPSGEAYVIRKEAAEVAMQAQIDLARNNDPNSLETITKIQMLVKAGNPVSIIKETVSEIAADMIILGARGKKRSKLEKMLGTHSTTLASKADCPVLVVPEGFSFKPIVQMAYAANLLASDGYELWSALEMIKPFSPIVRFVHVSTQVDDDEMEKVEKMRKHLESQNSALQLTFYQIYAKKIDQELTDFTINFEIDLLVIFHRSRNIFQQFLSSSHTKRLVSKLEVPMLVLGD